jgi:hypothetical protein
MNTIGVILLAAATATSGVGGKPHVFKKAFRHHAVQHGAPPASGPISAASMGVGGPGGMAGMGGAGGGFGENRRFPNVRSQVFFVDPPGMLIGWQSGGGPGTDRVYLPAQLTVPARYNFMQGFIYRLKLTNIPGRPALSLYPTIEIAPSTPATDAFLTHNPIPVQFTEEDFDQVTAGNFVTKVVYLPDPKYQELAISGVETLVATRLEPGVDPVQEADRRGTILMVIRLGAIDLEMPSSAGAVVAPGGAMAPGTVLAPGEFVPPGAAPYPNSVAPPTAPAVDPAQPVDPALAPPVAPPAAEDVTTPAPTAPIAAPAVPEVAPAVPAAPEVAPPVPADVTPAPADVPAPAAPEAVPPTAGLPPLDGPVALP